MTIHVTQQIIDDAVAWRDDVSRDKGFLAHNCIVTRALRAAGLPVDFTAENSQEGAYAVVQLDTRLTLPLPASVCAVINSRSVDWPDITPFSFEIDEDLLTQPAA